MTIIIDDAGMGDLIFGVIIAVFRDSNHQFKYGIIDVKYFQKKYFSKKSYLKECSKIVKKLIVEFEPEDNEEILFCRGYIFDEAFEKIKQKFGEDRVKRIKVVGEAQDLAETAYLDELRNLGYEPIKERESKRAKSFFHMMNWLKQNPSMLKYAKTGWPRLKRYKFFSSN